MKRMKPADRIMLTLMFVTGLASVHNDTAFWRSIIGAIVLLVVWQAMVFFWNEDNE